MERLVTWLWQGTVLAVGVWGVLCLWRPNAASRYAIWWATLLAVLVLLVAPPLLTRLPLSLPSRDVSGQEARRAPDGDGVRQPIGATAGRAVGAPGAASASVAPPAAPHQTTSAPTNQPPRPARGGERAPTLTRRVRALGAPVGVRGAIADARADADAEAGAVSLLPVTLPAVPRALLAIGVGAWLGLALLGLVHLGVSVSHLRRMKRACRPFPRARERRLLRWLAVRDAGRGAGRGARVCLSEDVRSASALGLGAAIIAINPSLLADVDDEELDHIILHEYAHIQRWDDWLHVLQLALHAVLLVHPAVSWIGRALRLEREAACDDWVVERTRMATTYAHCLTKVAAFELAAPNDLIAAVGMVGRRGDLTRRIERLLAPRRIARTRLSAMPVASAAVALIAAMVGLWQLPPLVAMPLAAATPRLSDVAESALSAGVAGGPEGGGGVKGDGRVEGRATASAAAFAGAAPGGPAGSASDGAVSGGVAARSAAADPLALAAAVIIASDRQDASAAQRVASSMRRPVIAFASLESPREAWETREAQGARPEGGEEGSGASATLAPAPVRSAMEANASEVSAQPHSSHPSKLSASTMIADAAPSASHVLNMTASPIVTPRMDGGGLRIASDASGAPRASLASDASAASDAEALDADTRLAEGVSTASRRAWQRAASAGVAVGQGAAGVGVTVGQGAASVGATVGQGAAAVGVSVGQRAADVGQATANLAAKTPVRGTLGAGASVGHGAKRVGVATGGFFTRVASSIGKALP